MRARCTGLYVGAFCGHRGLSARALAREQTDALAHVVDMAAVPTTVDFARWTVGVWDNTHMSRFLTASLLGVVSASTSCRAL